MATPPATRPAIRLQHQSVDRVTPPHVSAHEAARPEGRVELPIGFVPHQGEVEDRIAWGIAAGDEAAIRLQHQRLEPRT